jgi:UDP-GlcNAc:undecaprenyl-phosphate GlcNAc-1-phosphate transferase
VAALTPLTASLAVPLVVAAAVGLLLQPLLIRSLRAHAIMDVPGERSSHLRATPRGGGIAVLTGLVLALLLAVRPAPLLVAAVVLFAVLGALDDVRGLPPGARLVGQALLGVAAAVVMLPALSGAFPAAVPAAVVAAAVAAWLVLYVNAFNFMDGINGISALQTVVMGVALGTAGVLVGAPVVTAWAAALVGAGLAFLPFNAGTARVFLGDVGSYGLGAGIALLGVQAVAAGVPVWVVVAIPAVYLSDVLVTVGRRWTAGRPLFAAHREHTYQRLTPVGSAHLPVAAAVTAVSAAVAGCVLLAWVSGDGAVRAVALLAGAAGVAGYLVAPRVATAGPRPGPVTVTARGELG